VPGFRVSRSSRYDHNQKDQCDRRQENAALAEQISVWTADIISMPSQGEGWLNLAAKIDLCSKRRGGEAFEPAVKNWSAPELHYSDELRFDKSSLQKIIFAN
jgi:hypothetical protein